MLPSSPMLSAHDAADSRLHHGNDCGDVATVLLSLCSRRETSQDAKVDLKPLIVAIIIVYCFSETINVIFFLFLTIFNKLILFSDS
jgi:hypothetical protein